MSMVDLVRRLVREQLNRINTVVTNIHGAVAGESPPLGLGVPQRWMWIRLPARALLSLEEFFDAFATSNVPEVSIVEGREGVVTVGAANRLQFLRGVVEIPNSLSVRIAASAGSPQSEVAIYVDGVLQRRAVDSLEVVVSLDAGRHVFEILALADALAVAVPSDLPISAVLETLGKPQWLSVRAGYLDPAMGVAGNTLEWYNDARAGGWRLLRRETEFLGAVKDLGSLDTRGEYSLAISGDVVSQLEAGEELTAGPHTMGTVLNATYFGGDDETTVRLRLPASELFVDSNWLSRPVGSGRFSELARIKRGSTTGTIKYIDQDVVVGTVYEYKLQAFGLVDEWQVGPYSDIEYLRAGDIDPPGPILFLRGYPRLEGRRVSCRFRTPDDEDYDGVRTYFRERPVSGDVTSAGLTFLTDSSQSWALGQFAGWTVQVMSGGVMQNDLLALVVSNDNTTLFPSGEFAWIPSGGLPFELYYDRPIVTDFGRPSSEDQFSFEAIRDPAGTLLIGTYIFRTFDFTGNEQLGSGEQLWVFSGVTSPRTIVEFEDRDLAGELSTIKALAYFTVTPEIRLVESGTVTWVSGDQFEDALVPRVSGDYTTGQTNHHFVHFYPTPTPGTFHVRRGVSATPRVVRRIVASESPNLLYLDQAVPTAGSGIKVASGDRYEIYDGATFAHIGLTRAASLSALIPVYGPQVIVRADPGKFVEYYSVVDGYAPEELQTTFLDNDTEATIGKLLLSEPLPNVLMIRIDELDDDVRSWRSYEKKALIDNYSGGWPTLNGLNDGELDEAYLRWDDSIRAGKGYSHTAGDGCWYVIAVPVNSLGVDGPRVGCVRGIGGVVCSGGCGTDSQIFYEAAVRQWNYSGGTEAHPGYNLITWKFTSAGVNPELLEVRILAQDLDEPSGLVYDLTHTYKNAFGDRFIDQDATTGADPWGNEPGDTTVQVQGGVASYVHGTFNKHWPIASGGVLRTWRYTLQAWDSTDTLLEEVIFDYTSSYHPGLPASTLPFLQNVSASTAYEGFNSVVCDDPYTNVVQWEVHPATHPMDDLFVLHVYVDDGTTVTQIASDLPIRAFTSWYHALSGLVSHWSCTLPRNVLHTYRVDLAYADPSKRDPNYSNAQGVVDSITTNSVAGLLWQCDGVVVQGGCGST